VVINTDCRCWYFMGLLPLSTVFWMRACGQEPHKSAPYEELKETTKELFTNSKIAKSMRPGGTAQK